MHSKILMIYMSILVQMKMAEQVKFHYKGMIHFLIEPILTKMEIFLMHIKRPVTKVMATLIQTMPFLRT